KFVAIDGSTMDQFSIAKTAKKAVIERISDDTFSDTNIKQVSDNKVTKAKPLAQQEVTEDKPSISFKLDEEEATTDTKAKPLADQVEQEQDKPAMTAKLGDDPPTDDKPISLSEEKVDSSEKEKSASFQSSDNVDKSHVQDLLESSENNSPIDDEVSDSDKVKSIDTNQRDPFASLN
ncbi:MAG: hypothetical protein ACRD80_08630, partial [Nitrososphaeraceae archaeon]